MNVFKAILKSFHHASKGLLLAFKTERSFRIQLAVSLPILASVFILPLHNFERLALLLCVAAVLVLELLNSTVERVVDMIKPRLNAYVGDVKDIMAGTVLIASIFAAFIGFMILWPYFQTVLERV